VALDQGLQLAHELRVAAELELQLDPLDQGGELEVVQPRRLKGRVALQRRVAERGPSPEREGVSVEIGRARDLALGRRPLRLFQQALELDQVQLPWLDAQQVARRARQQHACRQHLPQPRHVVLNELRRPCRRCLTPQLVHEPIAGHDLVRVQEEHRQQRPLLRRPQLDQHAPLGDLERPEDPELH
jgi:hypothetical protein